MKLALITDDGDVVTVAEDIEEYNLDKSFARKDLLDAIKRELRPLVADRITAIHEEEDRYAIDRD